MKTTKLFCLKTFKVYGTLNNEPGFDKEDYSTYVHLCYVHEIRIQQYNAQCDTFLYKQSKLFK